MEKDLEQISQSAPAHKDLLRRAMADAGAFVAVGALLGSYAIGYNHAATKQADAAKKPVPTYSVEFARMDVTGDFNGDNVIDFAALGATYDDKTPQAVHVLLSNPDNHGHYGKMLHLRIPKNFKHMTCITVTPDNPYPDIFVGQETAGGCQDTGGNADDMSAYVFKNGVDFNK